MQEYNYQVHWTLYFIVKKKMNAQLEQQEEEEGKKSDNLQWVYGSLIHPRLS